MTSQIRLSVGLCALVHDTHVDWGLATNDDRILSGTLRNTTDEAAGLLVAFERLLALPRTHPLVDLFCGNEAFLDTLRPLAAAWPWLTHHDPTPQGVLVLRARAAARDRYRERVPAPEPAPAPGPALTIAAGPAGPAGPDGPATSAAPAAAPAVRRIRAGTDGSVGSGVGRVDKVSAFGWVTELGRHHSGVVANTANKVVYAELRAVHDLLMRHEGVTFDVVMDSTEAIRVLQRMKAGTPLKQCGLPPPSRHVRWIEALHAWVMAGDHTFTWVLGHSGNPYNDAADRLAVQARRHRQGMLDEDTHRQVVDRILGDFHAALAAAPHPDASHAVGATRPTRGLRRPALRAEATPA